MATATIPAAYADAGPSVQTPGLLRTVHEAVLEWRRRAAEAEIARQIGVVDHMTDEGERRIVELLTSSDHRPF